MGTELETFDRYAEDESILKKEENEIWIGYCGTLGSSYDIHCAIDAISIVDDPRLKFIVMGDGPKMNEFKQHATMKNINVVFTGRLQYNEMCSLLKQCDININPIVHGSAGSIINKHADYAASGKPVVSSQESREYRELVEKYHMGFNCDNNNAKSMAEKIKLLVDDEVLRIQMGANARKCAEECFDRKQTYQKLVEVICAADSTK